MASTVLSNRPLLMGARMIFAKSSHPTGAMELGPYNTGDQSPHGNLLPAQQFIARIVGTRFIASADRGYLRATILRAPSFANAIQVFLCVRYNEIELLQILLGGTLCGQQSGLY